MPLVMAMMAMSLLTALGAVLVLGTMTETMIAGSYRENAETLYAAEAAVELASGELAATSDWDAVLSGSVTSTFVDGPSDGSRRVGAVTLDLTEATADVNALAQPDADGITPSYALFAHGPLRQLLPTAASSSSMYVAVWLADLPGGAVGLVGRAYGATGSRRSVLVSLARAEASDEVDAAGVRVLSWENWR